MHRPSGKAAFLLLTILVTPAQSAPSGKTVEMVPVTGFTGAEIIVATDSAGAGAVMRRATAIALPAQAGPPSPNNFRPVLDATGRTFWVHTSSVSTPARDTGAPLPPQIICDNGMFAPRGWKACQQTAR